MGGEREGNAKGRPGIEVRGGSIRLDFYWNGQRYRETLNLPPTRKNLAFAEAKRTQILHEIAFSSFDYSRHFPDSVHARRTAATRDRTLAQGLDLWLKTRDLTPTTRDRYRRAIAAHFDAAQSLGSRQIRTILASELLLLRSGLLKKLSPKTVNNLLTPLRGAFELARADGIIDNDPSSQLVNARNGERDGPDPFSVEEMLKLLQVFRGGDLNMIDFAWSTGMRAGEYFGLEWGDIDWAARTATIRRARVEDEIGPTKTRRRRKVQLNSRAIDALTRQRAITGLAGETVFCNPDTAKPYTHAVVWYRKWQRGCHRAKVRFRPPKELRHTYASLSLSAGETPLFVASQLGHTSLTMLERHYAKWMPTSAKEDGRSFERLTANR